MMASPLDLINGKLRKPSTLVFCPAPLLLGPPCYRQEMRRSCGRALLYAASLLAVLSPSGCPGSAAPRLPSDGARNDAEVADLSRPIDHGSVEAEVPQDLPAPSPDSTPSGPAYLHADVWSIWWNDRTRCGAERTFLQICQARGEADCSLYQQAYVACNRSRKSTGRSGRKSKARRSVSAASSLRSAAALLPATTSGSFPIGGMAPSGRATGPWPRSRSFRRARTGRVAAS